LARILFCGIGGRQASEALRLAETRSPVVFGTLDEPALRRLEDERRRAADPEVPVYFYESG